MNVVVVAALTLLSGVLDAQGFLHASRMWDGSRLVGRELALSAGGFFLGLSCYWLAIRFARYLGVETAAVQTLGWFVVTIVGVAVMSGDVTDWRRLDQGVAVVIAVLMALLLYRTAE